MAIDYQKKWQRCLDIIRDNVGEHKFDTWFACAKAVAFDEESQCLTLHLPSHFFYEKYEDTFYNLIVASLRHVFGPGIHLAYTIGVIADDEDSQVTISPSAQSRILTNKTAYTAPSATTRDGVTYEAFDSKLNPIYNFENYCVGQSNKLPHTIAEYIASHPEKQEFNPFFLWGNVGVGKTHLLQAIGIRIKERNPEARVAYLTLREFSNQLSRNKIEGTIPQFINWYQHLDVLLLDDLQELSGLEGTMNALYPIFNFLHQHNKKLIFTCDRPPIQLEGITDRLIDRFRWGITEELPAPDYTLRRQILMAKARKNGLALSEEVIDFIANHACESVRELEGIVMGIMTRSIQLNLPIDLELAKSVMKNISRIEKHKAINFEMIVETTAEHYHLNSDVIFSKSRVRDISDARQVIMYLAHKHTQLSMPAIGQRLNRQHTTVLHGINAVRDRLPLSHELTVTLEAIEADLRK